MLAAAGDPHAAIVGAEGKQRRVQSPKAEGAHRRLALVQHALHACSVGKTSVWS